MGNGMNKVLPGLYVGNYRDSKDAQQLMRFNITHIVAIHDSPRRLIADKHYLCVMAADTPDQNLSQYFSVCNDFIHAARLRDGNVLIHCLAGMSRSVTVAVAYIMSVTPLSWKEALKVVRAGRSIANPNLGFQTQLQDFEQFKLTDERRRLRERFPSMALENTDREQCGISLNSYEVQLNNKNLCEGNCVRGQECPTGLCNQETSKGIFRRKASTTSTSSRLSVRSTTQSCPTSPRYALRRNSRLEGSSTALAAVAAAAPAVIEESPTTPTKSNKNGGASELHRSASTVSTYRPRSSPAGFHSYTGSAPTSVHGSRVDLSAADKGSAIYVGCQPPRGSVTNLTGTSTWSLNKGGNSSPSHTPPSSPRQSGKKQNKKQVGEKQKR